MKFVLALICTALLVGCAAPAPQGPLKPMPEIGMSRDQVAFESRIGRPDRINHTVTANGRRDQWVYDCGLCDYKKDNGMKPWYLYFDNGVLTGIQN